MSRWTLQLLSKQNVKKRRERRRESKLSWLQAKAFAAWEQVDRGHTRLHLCNRVSS